MIYSSNPIKDNVFRSRDALFAHGIPASNLHDFPSIINLNQSLTGSPLPSIVSFKHSPTPQPSSLKILL